MTAAQTDNTNSFSTTSINDGNVCLCKPWIYWIVFMLNFHFILWQLCADSMIWLGLGTNATQLVFGKHHVLG